MRNIGKHGCCLVALLVLCLAGTSARAATVDIGTSGFNDNVITLPSSALTVSDFVAGVAGTVTLAVADLRMGDLFSALSTSITLFDGRKIQLEGSGSTIFDIGPNQRFTTSIYAQTSGTKGFGVYNIDISFQPRVSQVPLPLGAWLLLSGCGLMATRIRRTRVISGPAAA